MRPELFPVSVLQEYLDRRTVRSPRICRRPDIDHKHSRRSTVLFILQPLSLGLCRSRDHLRETHKSCQCVPPLFLLRYANVMPYVSNKTQTNSRNTKIPLQTIWNSNDSKNTLNHSYVPHLFRPPFRTIYAPPNTFIQTP